MELIRKSGGRRLRRQELRLHHFGVQLQIQMSRFQAPIISARPSSDVRKLMCETMGLDTARSADIITLEGEGVWLRACVSGLQARC